MKEENAQICVKGMWQLLCRECKPAQLRCRTRKVPVESRKLKKNSRQDREVLFISHQSGIRGVVIWNKYPLVTFSPYNLHKSTVLCPSFLQRTKAFWILMHLFNLGCSQTWHTVVSCWIVEVVGQLRPNTYICTHTTCRHNCRVMFRFVQIPRVKLRQAASDKTQLLSQNKTQWESEAAVNSWLTTEESVFLMWTVDPGLWVGNF